MGLYLGDYREKKMGLSHGDNREIWDCLTVIVESYGIV